MSLSGLTTFVDSIIKSDEVFISGGTYTAGTVTFSNSTTITGFTNIKWYAENISSSTALPIASGENSIAIGGAEALNNNMFVVGNGAGVSANGANNSNFIGQFAGKNAYNSSYSNFFGYNTGLDNNGSNNIIIGTNINIKDGNDSINIGGILFGIGTYNVIDGIPSSEPQENGKIGIGVITPSEKLDVAGAIKLGGSSVYVNIVDGDNGPVPDGGAGTMIFDTINKRFFGWDGDKWAQLSR